MNSLCHCVCCNGNNNVNCIDNKLELTRLQFLFVGQKIFSCKSHQWSEISIEISFVKFTHVCRNLLQENWEQFYSRKHGSFDRKNSVVVLAWNISMSISMYNLQMIKQHTEHKYSDEKVTVSIRGMRSNKWTLYIEMKLKISIILAAPRKWSPACQPEWILAATRNLTFIRAIQRMWKHNK